MSNSGETKGGGVSGLLRVAALPAVVAGAAGSVGFMLWVGRQNPSRLLMAMFTVWVLSPFAALLLADRVSTRWSKTTRATLHAAMLVLAVGSVVAYGSVALGPPRSTPAFLFLIVPLASWLLMAVAVAIAAFISGRR